MVQKIRKAMPKAKAVEKGRQSIKKFVSKKPTGERMKREKNQYYFRGFYDRLKNIDVKQSHSMDQLHNFDNLIDEKATSMIRDPEGDGQLQSNFIEYLRAENMNNRTIEFKKVFSQLEPLCFSHALILINKKAIVNKLLGYLKNEGSENVLKGAVLELIIALIKDLRQDIYTEFSQKIMPSVIEIIDVTNLMILDKVFTLFSYSMKYLLKQIRADVKNFWEVFGVLIAHRNKHLRHFAAQSFSHVLRKITIDQNLIDIIHGPMANCEEGLSDLWFEVMYGASQELHSKSADILDQLLQNPGDGKYVRYLFIKLFNGIDAAKQQTLFESIQKNLLDHRVGLLVIQDSIKLKFGSRLSHLSVLQVLEMLNQIVSKKAEQNQELLAETLSYLYYFKHAQLVKIYQSSNVDISQKTIFTNFNFCQNYQSYFTLFLKDSRTIQPVPKELDLDFAQILGLKTSGKTSIEFTAESHTFKLRQILPAFERLVLKNILSGKPGIIEQISLLNQLVTTADHPKSKASPELEKAVRDLITKSKGLETYNLVKFAKQCQIDVKKETKFQELKLNLQDKIQENQVLRAYPGINMGILENWILKLLDLQNKGYEQDIDYNTGVVADVKISNVLENPSSLLVLNKFYEKFGQEKFTFQQNQNLADAISSNLMKNSRQVRLISLKILQQFEPLDFEASQDSEVEISSTFTGPCIALPLLFEFEKTDITFEFEKNKELQLRRLEVIIKSTVMPKQYNDIIYNFLIGSLWIRFAPIQQVIQDCVAAILKDEKLVKRHAEMMRSVQWIAQLQGHENDEQMKLIMSKVDKTPMEATDILSEGYLKDTRLDETYLEVKDFFYQLTKALSGALTTILPLKELREPMFDVFYGFVRHEYNQVFSRKKLEGGSTDLVERMTQANVMDSDSMKLYRRTTYSSLAAYLELFKRAHSLKQVPQIAEFQSLMISLLSSTDTKMQKNSLECLTKSGYNRGILTKYAKLLEGFADDEKFKDMIPIMVHGSGATAEDEPDLEEKPTKKRKDSKAIIPKLENEDRESMLPIIMKLLQSKLLQKKGAINQKSIHTRRNLIFQFYATFDKEKEFPLIANELLQMIGLTLDDCHSDKFLQVLSTTSFNTFFTFVNQLESMVKQMGTLMIDLLPQMTRVLINGVVKLAKMFIQQLKNAKNEDEEMDKGESEEEEEEEGEEAEEKKLHWNAGKQAKSCLRKSLGLVKDIYRKFSYEKEFIQDFSQNVYQEIISDQLDLLKSNYICDKSQLLEIVCNSWTEHNNTLQNYEKYPSTIPSAMNMLTHEQISPDVAHLLVGLVKNLIVNTIDEETTVERRRALKENVGESEEELDNQADRDMLDEAEITAMRKQTKFMSQRILSANIEYISSCIHKFWFNHTKELKHALSTRGPIVTGKRIDSSMLPAILKKQRDQSKRFFIAKDLLYILSELSTYLPNGNSLNRDFLSIIVQILGIRHLHRSSKTNDDLLLFGVKCVTQLVPKLSEKIDDVLMNEILQLFMHVKSPKVRAALGKGIQSLEIMNSDFLEMLVEMNKIKRGLADMEHDIDSAIKAIQNFMEKEDYSLIEINSITYCIIFLMQHEEYSMREYALNGLNHVFKLLKGLNSVKLVEQIETQIVKVYLINVKDELVLKSVLQCLKSLITFVHQEGVESKNNVGTLQPLIMKDENEDFFHCILSIKLKARQKCIKRLVLRIEEQFFNIKTFENVIMPIIEFLVFCGEVQLQSGRNTISYDKEHKRTTLEEALNVFTAFARLLSWTEYYKLLKKLLYRLQRARSKVNSISAYGQPELEKEKIITRSICKVLTGFHFDEVPDAVKTMVAKNEAIKAKANKAGDVNLFGNDFAEILKQHQETQEKGIEEVPDDVVEQVDEGSDDEIPEPVLEEIEEVPKLGESKIKDIQIKLLTKVLPVLERHLSDSKDKHNIRSFVAVSYVQTIRRLPISNFNQNLHKILNMIVNKGLGSRDLSHREKARKAISKIVEELSPRILSLVFEEMKNQLTKGFQVHVYLYSVHSLLASLAEAGALSPGVINKRVVDLNIDILLSELFGDLNEEKTNAQNNNQKLIKEAKSRKAMPIFEILAEYVDFKTNFLSLLAPIIKVLDESPNFSKIQQCEDLLSRISSSLMKNATVEGTQILLFLYSITNRGIQLSTKIKINDDKEFRDYGAILSSEATKKTKHQAKLINFKVDMFWHKSAQTIGSKKTEEISGRVMASFGLQCLKKALKNKSLIPIEEMSSDQQKQDLIERLDPFVILILNSFKTYHNPIVVTSLNIMSQIVTLGLPSFKENLGRFLSRIFKLFEQSSDNDFINSLFKCTSELIKTYSVYKDLSEIQIKTLVEIIKSHMHKFAVQSNALNCLRSVIHRKFACSELYDLMEQVQEMMLSSNTKQIRTLCSAIFVQFLLDYPLQNERIEQHINFMLKNLSYKQIDNRIALMGTLQTLIERFPPQIVELYGELLFFTLLLRVVNDENADCRDQVLKVMRALITCNKLSQSKIKTMLNTVLQMGSSDPDKHQQLALAKLHGFQLLAETSKLKALEIQQIIESINEVIVQESNEMQRKLNKSKKSDTIDLKARTFLQAIELDDSEEPEEEEEEELQGTLLFYALSVIERLMEKQQKPLVAQHLSQFGIAQKLFSMIQHHPSYWIRLVAHRVLGHLFFYQSESKSDLLLVLGLDIPEQISEMSLNMLDGLRKQVNTDDMQEQIVKNLIFLTNYMLQKGQDILPLIRKASFIGRKVMLDRKTAEDRLKTILQYFQIGLQLVSDHEITNVICGPILDLVYRTTTDDQYAATTIREISQDIEDFLQKNVPKYLEIYMQVKSQILSRRTDRKIKSKALVSTQEGQEARQRKRTRKYEKKKKIHTEKVFMTKMHR